MDQATPRSHSPILGLYCNAFGHDYIVIQNRTDRTDQINAYKCVCCGRQANLEQLFEQV